MIRLPLIFLTATLVSGVFAFAEIAASAQTSGKMLFFVCLAFFVLSILMGKRTAKDAI